ncbi:MAG: SulP family inorganic anion transporter, partial [Planctomycetota bacterium]
MVRRIFPFLRWFEGYNSTVLRADLISGVTVALVLIPQSMAYAQLAGLPAYYGLYAAFLPPMVAALFGSSNQLATGPVAVVSLMTAATLEPLATAGSTQYIAYAIILALLVGMFQLALGLLRLGLVVNFLSHPVVNGFTNAAALIIATSQLSKIFGVYVDKADHHYETIARVVVAAVHRTHWPTLGMAALAFAIMIGLKRIQPKIPNVLVAVVVTTLIAWAVGLENNATVDLAQVHDQRVQQLIRQFNQAIIEKEELERLRALQGAGEETSAPAADQGSEVCTSCHGARSLTVLGKGREGHHSDSHSGRALALHHASGLLDLRIQQIKGHLTRYRTELRGLRFVGV